MLRNEKELTSVHNFIQENKYLIQNCFTQRTRIEFSRIRNYVNYFIQISIRGFNSTYYLYCLLRLLMFKPRLVVAQLTLRKGGGLAGNYQWIRLWELKRFLDRNKPSSIVEFGSGASTLLFSSYIGTSLSFTSLEENESWRQEVLNSAKKLGSKCFEILDTSLILAPRIETIDLNSGILTCRYQYNFGDSYFEMAYVDGPTNWVQDSHEWISDGFDPYNLLPNSDITVMHKMPKFVVIDGRRSSIKYFL